MTRPYIAESAGPGSSISLAPETLRIRDALIEKFIGEPLDTMNNFLASALEKEKDEERRLGILAARIYILRHRVQSLKDFERDHSLEKFQEPTSDSLHAALPKQDEDPLHETIDTSSEDETTWFNIRMTEPGEVNGVRFFEGTIINAKKVDADRLISAGKAVVVDDEGNKVDFNEVQYQENLDHDEADNGQSLEPSAGADEVSPDENEESNQELEENALVEEKPNEDSTLKENS